MHCDKKMVLVFSEYPPYSIKFNIHDHTLKEDGCCYFSFRIGEEANDEQREVFSAILCPLSDEGIPDKRFPGKRYIDKAKEKVADYFEGGSTGNVRSEGNVRPKRKFNGRDFRDMLLKTQKEQSDKDDES